MQQVARVQNHVFELRKKHQITQEELAQEIGVSRQTVVAIEKGNYTPSVALALALAEYFKVQVEDLFLLEYE